MKRIFKILRYTIAILLLLYLSARIALQSNTVQTFLTHKTALFLSGKLNTKVTVGAVEIELIKTLVLKDVYIEDRHNDTLVYVGFLKGDIADLNFSDHIFSFNEIIVQRGKFHLKYYEGDSLLNLQFIIDALSGADTASSEKASAISCGAVTIEHSQFTLNDYNIPVSDFGFDYNHIGIYDINGKVSEILINGDTISGNIENISATERSGLALNNLTAKVTVCPEFAVLNGLKLSTANSEADGDVLFNYSEYPEWYDFLNKVKISSHITRAELNLSDISYFATPLKGMNQKIILSGNVKGPVSRLRGKNLRMQFGPNSFFKGNITFDGLPNIDETFITLNIDNLETNSRDIELIPVPPYDSAQFIALPENVSYLGKMTFKGNFTGFINDFVAHGKFNSSLGNFSSDLKLSTDTTTNKISYNGHIASAGFNIGKLLGLDSILKTIAGNFSIDGSGLKKENLHLNMNGNITAFDIKNYRYKAIKIEGEITKDKFKGLLAVNDQHIQMNFDGFIDFEPKLPVFRFESKINNANLFALNLLKRDSVSALSTDAKINFSGNTIDNIQGSILLLKTNYREGNNSFEIDTIHLLAQESASEKMLTLNSDFASGKLQGRFNMAELAPSFNYIIAQILPSYFAQKPAKPKVQQQFTYNINIHKTEKITKIFSPDLMLQTINIRGKYHSDEKEIKLEIDAPAIKYGQSSLANLTLDLSSSDDILSINSSSDRLNLNDSIAIENVNLLFKLTNDNVQFGYSWKNEQRDSLNYSGSINGLASIYGNNKFRVHFLSSEIMIADSIWKFADDNEISMDTSSITFNNFMVKSSEQKLTVAGKISENEDDHLIISLANFNLENFNILTLQSGIKLGGFIQGEADISRPYTEMLFTSDIAFDKLTFNNELLGNGEFISDYNSKEKSIGINGFFGRDAGKTVFLQGYYYPEKKQNALDLTADINQLNISLFSPYTTDIVSKLKGSANGKIKIQGNTDAPELSGKINISNAEFLFDYLNTYYTIHNAEVVIEKNWIGFNNVIGTDAKGNAAVVTGTVLHDNYKNFNMDISVEAKNFQALNTNSILNSLYYGKAYMTGLVNISGNPDNIVIDINAKSEKGTEFFIPLSGPAEVAENEFIQFIVNDTLKIKPKEYRVDLTGIQLNFKLDVTPEAKIELIFDEIAGDIMKARGSGNLMLEINTRGDFNMYGEYVVSEGEYLFTLENIINKKFEVKEGGTITWNGNPYDAQLDLDAVYKLRAPLSDITGDTAMKKRVPVECHMLMTNKLFNPEINFDVQLPTVGQEEQNALKLVTSTVQDMNKQVFSLLILNRFYPEQGGPTTGGQVVGASSSELLSNQLSNWLSQTTKIVNLGVSYRSDKTSGQEVAVALSKQLFNERISIESNVGVSNTNETTGENTNILDATIEYKISDDGRLKAKIFNESNDRNLANANQSPYTQGAGIFYREEFDTFGQFFRNLFKRKKEN